MRSVVYYGAPAWCVPCKRFKPQWDKFVKLYDPEVITFIEADIDLMEPGILRDRNIVGVPSVVVYEDNVEALRLTERTTYALRDELDHYLLEKASE